MTPSNQKHGAGDLYASLPKELVKPLDFGIYMEELQNAAIASTGETMKRCSSSNVCTSNNMGVNGDTDLLF